MLQKNKILFKKMLYLNVASILSILCKFIFQNNLFFDIVFYIGFIGFFISLLDMIILFVYKKEVM